jgi:hypothetical protein
MLERRLKIEFSVGDPLTVNATVSSCKEVPGSRGSVYEYTAVILVPA